MKPHLDTTEPRIDPRHLDKVIARSGIRLTPQRRVVYEALLDRRDHPTALEVFLRVKERMASISLATVYNCLEALTESGLVKHVSLDRAPSRYCPNTTPHAHFFCTACSSVFDVPLAASPEETWELPPKTIVTHTEITLRGLCPKCAPTKNL
jgi:Fur family peroxide stress response transcriptional regulator